MSENGVTNVRYVASTSYQNLFVPHSTTDSKVLWTHPCLQLVLISRAKSGQSDLRSVGHLSFQPPMAGDLYCPSPRRLANRESRIRKNLIQLETYKYTWKIVGTPDSGLHAQIQAREDQGREAIGLS